MGVRVRVMVAGAVICCAAALVLVHTGHDWTAHAAVSTASESAAAYTPTYTKDGDLVPPLQYREWVYLTTGLDMSYTPKSDPNMHMFDNVFVNPEAYRSFQQTGTWPDKTVMVLEGRRAEQKVSINKRGRSQSAYLTGLEVHAKDAKLPGGWGFFEFGPGMDSAKMVPRTADCYSCHEMHAAVDTTFVQFYPTLIGVAAAKKTLSPEFLKEMAPAPK
jgi:hypothetical protein